MATKPLVEDLLHACDEWTQAVYTASPLIEVRDGEVTLAGVSLDVDAITATTDRVIGLAIGLLGPAAPQIGPVSGLKEHSLLFVRTNRVMPWEDYLAMRGTADAAVNQLRAWCQGQAASPPMKRKGRPRHTDPEADRRLHEAWKTSGYKTIEEFATKFGHKPREVKLALDRHAKRGKEGQEACE